MIKIWKEAFNNRKFIILFFITITFVIIIVPLYSLFLTNNELRIGVVLNDPILSLFTPINLSWLIFSVMYFCFIIAIIDFINKPKLFLEAIQGYMLLIIFRMLAMYLVPLEHPQSMIILRDPLIEIFSNGEPLKNDLFFSGHTATMFILFLYASKRYLKVIFIIAALVIAASVILQHVHYSFDVFTAPFFSFVSYFMIKKINNKVTI